MNNTRRQSASSAGFSLIEVIIVIAILAIVAGAMAPMAVRTIDSSRQESTLKRQQKVYEAIFGDPSVHGTGFLNDIGRIPGTNLTELVIRGTLPPYAIQPCGVGMGWRGPYLLEAVDAQGRPLDGWGTPMDFANGQIRSAGPDRSMSAGADNLYYPAVPITANNVYGRIALDALVLDTSTEQAIYVPAAGQATLCYARDGAMQTVTAASATGIYSFPSAGLNLPQGIHAIQVTGDPDGAGPQPSVTRSFTVFCPGGGTSHQTVALR